MELFQAAKTADITEVALALQLTGKRITRQRGMFCCPFHADKSPSMYTYRDNRVPNTFYCFGCRQFGDGADLAAQVLHLKGPAEGARWVCQTFNIPYEERAGAPQPLLTAPPQETQILRAAVQSWRKYRVRYFNDKHERIRQQIDELELHGEASPDLMRYFDELVKAAAIASEDRDRWECMSVGSVLEEMKLEIMRHLPENLVTKDVPFYGEIS